MDISELDLFIVAMSNYLRLNQPFNIVEGNKKLLQKPLNLEETHSDLRCIKIFSNYLVENVAVLNYKEIPEESYLKIRFLVDLLEKFVKSRKKKYRKIDKKPFNDAEEQIFAIRLGGKISLKNMEFINEDFRKFLKVNKLDHKLFALGIQLNGSLALSFQVDENLYEEICWKDLVRENLIDESGRLYGYSFYNSEHLVMETNVDFLLTESFSFLYQGIRFYHPENSLKIEPLDKKGPFGRNILEIVSNNSSAFSFILLYKEDGTIYAIGLHKGKIVAPAPEYFILHKCRYRMEITNDEFGDLLSAFESEKIRKDTLTEMDFLSIMQRNLNLETLPDYSWKELFMKKCKILKMNRKAIKQWLLKVLLSRNGDVNCFE